MLSWLLILGTRCWRENPFPLSVCSALLGDTSAVAPTDSGVGTMYVACGTTEGCLEPVLLHTDSIDDARRRCIEADQRWSMAEVETCDGSVSRTPGCTRIGTPH